MSPAHGTRDIVVLGASLGGLEAVSQVLSALPPDFHASVFVALHSHPGFASNAPQLLGRHTALPVAHALHGERVEPGKVYVAPPDNHLQLRDGFVHVARGPKENGHRPSVDALFRSASKFYGPRVIGVVLTGGLDCGTAGLLSIKARHGIAIVQDPKDAVAPGMPESALRHVEVDQVAPLAAIGDIVVSRASEEIDWIEVPEPLGLREFEGDALGKPFPLACPDCEGVLTRSEISNFEWYRCHVGHAYSPEGLISEQAEALERALWESTRALEESASLAARAATRTTGAVRARLEEKARLQQANADLVRRMLLSDGRLNRADATLDSDARSN